MASENPSDTGITTPSEAPPVVGPPETGITAAPPETAIALPSGHGAQATDAARSLPMAAAEGDDSWLDKADWLLLGLVVALSFLVSSVAAYNSDLWMQMATGRLIAHGEYAFGADPFSFATESREGQPATIWVNHSWLFGLALYGLYSLTDGVGLIVAKGLLVAALTVLMLLTRGPKTNMLVMAICMTVGVLTMSARLAFLQPVLVSYLFLGMSMYVLNRAGAFEPPSDVEPDAQRARVLWWLPALFVLWVNLDNWFVLGPIAVGLVWAGLALQRFRGMGNAVPLRLIGAVFGVGLLACVVNPFHVRAFQLPPELAYPLVRAGEAMHVQPPDWLCAGGKTLAILRDVDPRPADLNAQLTRVLSPFELQYRTHHLLGWNIAGMCVFVLLALGGLSFVLHGAASFVADGPALQSARFAVWVFAAFLAVSNHRLVPFFAIVAAPITAMNLSELMGWYTRPAAISAGPTLWTAPIRMARLLGVPLLLALLVLAWPGWLHGPFEQISSRHVAWDIVTDDSMRQAAERLGQLQKAQPDRPLRVFSTGPDLGHYCAWHAPGVKCFFDGRSNLFALAADDYATARLALSLSLDEKRLRKSDWVAVFNRYGIDHVAVEHFLTGANFVSWWQEPNRWLPRFGDSQIAVFAWSKDRRWPSDAMLDEWNQLAFGDVSSVDRPPSMGPRAPAEARNLFERLFYPPARMPRTALEMDYKLVYESFVLTQYPNFVGWMATKPTPIYGLPCLPLSPASMNSHYGFATADFMIQLLNANRRSVFFAADQGPPAVPILVARLAWQSVDQAPDNERSHLYLADACTTLQRQENYWAAPSGALSTGLRDTLRRIQIASARRAAVEIGFADPQLQMKVHLDVANDYLGKHFLDLAAENLAAVDVIMETLLPEDPTKREAKQKERKSHNARRMELETEVGLRKQHFNIKAAGLKPLQKAAFALSGSYSVFSRDNKARQDPQGLGLGGLAMKILEDMDQKTLSPEEQAIWLNSVLELLFNTGRAREASRLVEQSIGTLEHFGFQHRYLIFAAGTQGNYDALRAALADFEQSVARAAGKPAADAVIYGVAPPPTGAPPQMVAMYNLELNARVKAAENAAMAYCEIKTLRGAIALEAGDTAEAYRILKGVLDESAQGGYGFPERRIAERYVTFLERYHKK